MEAEEWRDINGFETYQVSQFGSVRRKARKVKSVVPQHKGFRTLSEKMCAITDNGRGYKLVSFKIDGVRRNHYVHRLVADAFIPNHENLPQVNHIDGDKSNNHVENLEWVTNQRNRDHAADNNLISFGEHNGLAKLSIADVLAIKEELSHNPHVNKTKLGERYGVTCTTIIKIEKGQRWSRAIAIENGYSVKRTI